jgi:hypothetical protein
MISRLRWPLSILGFSSLSQVITSCTTLATLYGKCNSSMRLPQPSMMTPSKEQSEEQSPLLHGWTLDRCWFLYYYTSDPLFLQYQTSQHNDFKIMLASLNSRVSLSQVITSCTTLAALYGMSNWSLDMNTKNLCDDMKTTIRGREFPIYMECTVNRWRFLLLPHCLRGFQYQAALNELESVIFLSRFQDLTFAAGLYGIPHWLLSTVWTTDPSRKAEIFYDDTNVILLRNRVLAYIAWALGPMLTNTKLPDLFWIPNLQNTCHSKSVIDISLQP